MKNIPTHNFKYIINGRHDHNWGFTVQTVGSAIIHPNYENYPPACGHPTEFAFNPFKGRLLPIFVQLYIAKGKGLFFSSPNESMEIKEGDLILIPPYTWHSYLPHKSTGWKEYWIGFDCPHIENCLKHNLFNKNKKIYRIGIQDKIINLYEEAIRIANEEKSGYQQYLAGIANLIFCMIPYYNNNRSFDPATEDIINKAKIIMKEELLNGISPEKTAAQIKLSYSWFRKIFKDYTGVTPSQYIQELKMQEAKICLTTSHIQIKEIAYHLGYEDIAYFIKLFRRHTGKRPSEYRKSFFE